MISLQEIDRDLLKIHSSAEALMTRHAGTKGREFADAVKEQIEYPIWQLRNKIDNAIKLAQNKPKLSDVLEQKEAS